MGYLETVSLEACAKCEEEDEALEGGGGGV